MRLFIAEKPSLGRAIAEALPRPHARAGDAIRCGSEDIVAWCAGHILETATPETYSDEYKAWGLDHLPIVPVQWKLVVTNKGLFATIASWLKRANRVVHAGDPDREGQLLVDEVLHFLSYRGPVDRLLVRDLSPAAVQEALGQLESNSQFRPLYDAALARQRADWLYGMNMTRLYTVLGRKGGYDALLSVGRVQTPLLGLIVARDRAIEDFKPIPYFSVTAILTDGAGSSFRATWEPGGTAEPFLDAEDRLLKKEVALAVQARTEGRPGVVTSRTEERKVEGPPLPYALADLQVDAAKKLGLSAAQVLETCQRLYEQHHLVTYPRSDCAYLPERHFGQAESVLAAMRTTAPELEHLIRCANLTLHSKAWNEKKITAHHAIIPTSSARLGAQLSERERTVYRLIARRYLAQFYPPHEIAETRLEVLVAGERFRVLGKMILDLGWRAVLQPAVRRDDDLTNPNDEDADQPAQSLPQLAQGDAVTATAVTVADKQTRPPKPFTDASLIQAMCQVARYVENPAVKKILSDSDGIGTPATRASIIETLFDRGFITRRKRSVVSTLVGRDLIRALPEVATTPDMTAVWERALKAIAQQEQSTDAFLDCVERELKSLVRQGKALGSLTIQRSAPSAARARTIGARRSRTPGSSRPARRGP